MRKRILSMLLCVVLCLSLLPIMAFAATSYTVTFDANYGGGAMQSVQVERDRNGFAIFYFPKCEFKAPEGKWFGHWEVDGDATQYSIGSAINLTQDVTVKPVWIDAGAETEYYTVTFLPNGGSGTMPKEQVLPSRNEFGNLNFSYTFPRCDFTAPSGYMFDKWEDVDDGVQYETGTEVGLFKNITVKPSWVEAPIVPTPTNPCWNGTTASWENVDSSVYYYAVLYKVGDTSAIAVNSVKGEGFTDFADAINQNGAGYYYFEVSGYMWLNNMLFNSEAVTSASKRLPILPVLQNVNISDKGILSWDAFPNAAKYTVAVSSNPIGPYWGVDTNELSYNLFDLCSRSNLTKGKTAYVKLAACGSDGNYISEEWIGEFLYPTTAQGCYYVTFESNGGGGEMPLTPVYANNTGFFFTLPQCEFTAPTGKKFDHWDVEGNCKQLSGGTELELFGNIILKPIWVTQENTYPVWVSGKQITSANKNDVLGDGKVSYDPDTQTLTVLDSTNINTPYVYDSYYGLKALIVSEGIDLTISAPNSLTLGNITDEGLAVYDGNLIINGNVNFTATNDGACAIFVGGGSVTINGNADIRFNGAVGESDTNAICATNGITITGDVTVNGFEYGLYSSAGNITVNGKAVINTENFALDARGTNGIAVDKDINITVSEINATAISASAGNVTVGGKADIQFTGASNENSNDAIYAYGNIAITGDVEIDGFYNGIRSNNGDITLNGSAAITAISIGIYAVEGKVVMVSGKWDINTGNKAIIAKTGIEIPSTHAVTMPENGKIKTVDGNYTVTDFYGSTVAKHVIIKQNTASTIYTVSFNMNGHGDQVADQMVNAGEKVTEPAEPTEIGYMFVGWCKDSSFATAWNFDTDTVTENTTLYALWAQNTTVYTIIAGANGEWTKGSTTGLAFTSDAPFDKFDSVKIDGTVIAAANYTAEAGSTKITLAPAYLETLSVGTHTIEIVSNDGSASTNFTVKSAEQPPVVPANYTVSFNMNGHGDQVSAQTVMEGEKATKPTDPAVSGWTFNGWYADATFSAAFDFNTAINANTTVYAKWTEVKKDEPTKPADPTSPQTGDNSHLFLWVALLFISCGALAGTAVFGKKRNYFTK